MSYSQSEVQKIVKRLVRFAEQDYTLRSRLWILVHGRPAIKANEARKAALFFPEAVECTCGLPSEFQTLPVYLEYGRFDKGIEIAEEEIAQNGSTLDQQAASRLYDLIGRMKTESQLRPD